MSHSLDHTPSEGFVNPARRAGGHINAGKPQEPGGVFAEAPKLHSPVKTGSLDPLLQASPKLSRAFSEQVQHYVRMLSRSHFESLYEKINPFMSRDLSH